MKARNRALLLAVTAALTMGDVHLGYAQDASLNRAREHFDKAQALYTQEKYAEAAMQFQEAYDARPFAQLLFNIGACHEKLSQWNKAVEFYQRFLKEEPETPDRANVEKRIEILKKAAAAQTSPEQSQTTPGTTTQPSQPPPNDAEQAVATLDEIKIRGLVVIESVPAGALIYLDSKKAKPLARTPWNGTMEGEHTIIIERQGYKAAEKRFLPDPSRLLVMHFTLAEEDYLGWVDIKSNVPGADIYIDDKSVGVYNKTPYSGNLKPGKHKIWVSAPGYDEVLTEVNVVPGETHEIDVTLKGSPVGYLNVRGRNVEHVRVLLDGKLLCPRGPCRKPVKKGRHTVTIARDGYKPYNREIEMQAKTELTIRARLAEEPGRADAVWAYVFAAAFAGGGVYLGMRAKDIEDQLAAAAAPNMPPIDDDDPRFQEGLYYTYGADAAYAASAVSLLTAIYYTFREKGAPSTGTTDVRAVAFQPSFSPTYAGIGMEVSW